MERLVVEAGREGRLDVFVASSLEVARARAARLVDEGHVLVNGAVQRRAYTVTEGDVIDVAEPTTQTPEPPPGVEVIFEDAELLVVSKPSGVVVHGAPGVRTGTLVDALRTDPARELAEGGGSQRAGIVHRLDRDVSGLLVVAKTEVARGRLVEAIKARDVGRIYLALVAGSVQTDKGKIDAPVGRDPRRRTRMAVVASGRAAVTWFTVLERFADPECALLEVELETGRTHQIRTHLASIGHPVIGDRTYGAGAAAAAAGRLGLQRPFLHACRLTFAHPVSGRAMSFEAPLPTELERVLAELRT